MLNELFQVVEASERLGVTAPSLHPRIKPMGKNKNLLIICVTKDGVPGQVEVLKGESAATLRSVQHGSAGSSFPGFNLPTPLRRLDKIPIEKFTSQVEGLLTLAMDKNAASAALAKAIGRLFELSAPRVLDPSRKRRQRFPFAFTPSQESQFHRSCSELVSELREIFSDAPNELMNFLTLLATIDDAKPTLSNFTNSLAELLARRSAENDRITLLLFQDILFGVLDWRRRTAKIGTPDYWQEKGRQDEATNQPVYLDLVERNETFKRVAHSQTSAAIMKLALDRKLANTNAEYRQTKMSATKKSQERVEVEMWKDAFSGEAVKLATEFPQPRVAALGDLKLFSAYSKETKALLRYGLGGWKLFPTSEALAWRFNDELSKLASDANKGKTCHPIAGNRIERDKRTGRARVVKDLLVAYLDEGPEGCAQLAEMFGGAANTFSDADFAAVAQPVIGMLEGKVAANPNLSVRLLALCSLDKGRKQVSLNRCFRVADVIRAARDWQAGTRNAPEVSVWFYDKNVKQSVFRKPETPYPLELASTTNRVWNADEKAGFSSAFQRALSVSDAYDIFMAESPLAQQKAETALGLLVRRMSLVLAGLGAVKITCNWKGLGEKVRWQSLKTIALLGILLHYLGQHKEDFMREPIYRVGRLLALADGLHFHYCKFVRTSEEKRKAHKVDLPNELLGNSLFNFALDQPVSALARLAERIKPYKGWADTYCEEDSRLVHWFIHQMSETEKGLDVDALPSRMTDVDKAKLLLGYLADQKASEDQ